MSISKLSQKDGRRLDAAKEALAEAGAVYKLARESFDDRFAAATANLSDEETEAPAPAAAAALAKEIRESAEYAAMWDAWQNVSSTAEALKALCAEFAETRRESYESRSDSWRDSEKGEAVSSWLDQLESFEEPDAMPDLSAEDLARRAVAHGWNDAAEAFDHEYESALDAAEELSSAASED